MKLISRVAAVAMSMTTICIAGGMMSGCSAGPDYHKPEAGLPSKWDSGSGVSFHQGVPGDAAIRGNWWEVFGDASLNRLEQQALLKNQSLISALAHLDAARAQVNVVSAGLFPQAGLQAGPSRVQTSANRPLAAYGTANQSTIQNNDQLGFSVSYEADLFGRVSRSVESAGAQGEQATADLENTRLVLMSELAADYFNLRELDCEIDVIQQGIVLQERALNYIRARHDLGVASGLDLAQQQSVLDANRTQLELEQVQRTKYLHALATMSGMPAPGFVIAPELMMHSVPLLPVGVPSDVLQRRPDIASAERAMAVANANIGVARAAYYPTILLQANGGWDSNQLATLFNAPSVLWAFGASVTQTLFDGGKTTATIKMAEAAYASAVANYRQSVLLAMQEVADGIDASALLGRAGTESQASVKSAQRVLDLANDRYTGGLATYLDVITAQQALLTNQRQAVQIYGQQMLTSVYLIKALGGGWQVKK